MNIKTQLMAEVADKTLSLGRAAKQFGVPVQAVNVAYQRVYGHSHRAHAIATLEEWIVDTGVLERDRIVPSEVLREFKQQYPDAAIAVATVRQSLSEFGADI